MQKPNASGIRCIDFKEMTLRQEIQNIIEIIQYADTEQIYPDEETEKILNLFIRVIDEKIELIKSLEHKDCKICEGEEIRMKELKDKILEGENEKE